MALTSFLQVLSLALILNADTCGGAEIQPCPDDWFGSSCRYKCHCDNNTCDDNGECTGSSSTCEYGWFGPACQYVDLVSTNTTISTPAWVYDFPDTLCNTGQENVTVSLQDVFYFTWLRLHVNSAGTSQTFKLQFDSSTGSALECTNMHTLAISATILDIYCDPGVMFQQLTITGDGVRSLCSVYISGGRNVALRQVTHQTSDFSGLISSLAVDGDRNPFLDYGSCTHTYVDDHTPIWTLIFQIPHQVIRYDVYNRYDLQQRLRGFILEADDATGTASFSYMDRSNINQDIYRIMSANPQTPISSVNIAATYVDVNSTYLTLCEVEMFGDTVCPVGKYGRDCENTCNCARNGEQCFVSTGGCPSGCAPGYQGEGCQHRCSPTYYGKNCSQRCSPNCRDQLCEPSNGTCLSCLPGKQGLLCDKDCNPTFWGENCAQKCTSDCKDRRCDIIDGTCISCATGQFGTYCDQACNATYYGENCALRCSPNCNDTLCNAADGSCQSCVTGKSGLFCDQAPTSDEQLPVAAIVVPVVVGVVLITLIVIGVLFWRKRRNKQRGTRQTTPNRFQGHAETQSRSAADVTTLPTVMKKPQLSRGNRDRHRDPADGNYLNCGPGRSKTDGRFSDRDNFRDDHRNNAYQGQFNRVPANRSANSTENRNTTIYTNNTECDTYVIPMVFTPPTQRTWRLRYKDQKTFADDAMANPYDVIDDNVPNDYEDMHEYSQIT